MQLTFGNGSGSGVAGEDISITSSGVAKIKIGYKVVEIQSYSC